MGLDIASIIGGSVGDLFSKVVGTFKLSPEKAADLELAKQQHAADLATLQEQIQAKLQDSITNEIQSAAEIIKVEAASQSWLPKNVRPFLLLMWGMLITFNFFLPLVAQFGHVDVKPLALDPWVFKLTAIGFTGYVTARTWEKVTNSDQ